MKHSYTPSCTELPKLCASVKTALLLLLCFSLLSCSLPRIFSSGPSHTVSDTRLRFGGPIPRVHSGSADSRLLQEFFGKLEHPVARSRRTSGYGPRGRSFHHGVDFAARSGTPIVAAHDGEVIVSGRPMGGYGNMVVIRNGRFHTVYAHNRRNHVRVGQRVRRGEKIAEVGATGNATGPHLHFEVRLPDASGVLRSIDPEVLYVRGM